MGGWVILRFQNQSIAGSDEGKRGIERQLVKKHEQN
jgi:hypothetical protein